ncbi:MULTISPECIES: PleD family two-component system response regulator [Rhizobium/Agrobacterium group]|jgi:two-component system cell cycle response regulator|uniref:PleD family two-component system response regulator n=1 Tax=Rhizobium/Agrobacterium group TaxID=227290 RepID=UPI00023A13DE|nr:MULTISPECIES: PleD family two-component system response regulator [Rhizobium/Agrobacterium group]EHJ99628.1 response regulator PleD [Agrobacterium tumefaciens 5A]KQY53020.1 response regulator PleD [Rhizobium sp. Root491]MDR5008585.1 PleD family two-component system response regulator [Agrobacterium tumefaciens]NSY58335.1 PleD family two-component system response regulator [Agrobacterium tumefaciens]NSZ73415.1 PleD family two-component system response regulator [Agrobacterium tumefaciens]
MTARVLVVDDIPANVKLLEARLVAEYFDVVTAEDGFKALDICDQEQVDIILLDIMMPGMDGFEVCERLKANPKTAHIPVVMVTALDQPSDRVRGLKAGADDFLTKPVNDLQLIARVKSLVRLKAVSDELRLRAETAREIGIEEMLRSDGLMQTPGRVLVADGRASSQERIVRALKPVAEVDAVTEPQAALLKAASNPFELVIVNSNFEDYDPLRLCSQLRSLERTRFLPLLLVAEQGADDMVARALDLGVNDYILRPIDPNELVARSLTQIRRKRYNEHLRLNLQHTMELAIVDGLTGLNNRRYLDNHLKILFDRAAVRGRPISICMTDIDRFKLVNDTYGHDVGDEVLREFAARIRSTVRGADLACRYGGEEFVVVMPDTSMELATSVAERLRAIIEDKPFHVRSIDRELSITASLGIATSSGAFGAPDELLKQADRALYEAKHTGRNRVVAAAA